MGMLTLLAFLAHGDHGESTSHEPTIWYDVILVAVNVVLFAIAFYLAVQIYRTLKKAKR